MQLRASSPDMIASGSRRSVMGFGSFTNHKSVSERMTNLVKKSGMAPDEERSSPHSTQQQPSRGLHQQSSQFELAAGFDSLKGLASFGATTPPRAASPVPQMPPRQRASSDVAPPTAGAPASPRRTGLLSRTRSVYSIKGCSAADAAVVVEDEPSVSSTLPLSSASSSVASSPDSPCGAIHESSAAAQQGDRRREDGHDVIDDNDEEFPRRCREFARGLSRASADMGAHPSDVPPFDTPHLRRAMEPHVARARSERETSRRKWCSGLSDDDYTEYRSISSSIGVPYTCLRGERPFLFDEHTFPLHEALADCLGVDDLSMLHDDVVEDKARLLGPLLDRDSRRNFHAHYDHFVTAFCIPLLHSMALQKGMFHASSSLGSSSSSCCPGGSSPSSSDRITYRYQAFPTLRVVRPGEGGTAPSCDAARGHSVGALRFHVPLTASYGTNALFAESHPGREDWHPLSAKSGVGLGYLFDGARCLSFAPTNGTDRTRVSLDFHVLIHRETQTPRRSGSGSSLASVASPYYTTYAYIEDDLSTLADADGGLCTPEILEDRFTRSSGQQGGGEGYYEEACVELGTGGGGGGFTGGAFGAFPGPAVVRKNGNRLADPDERVGCLPFAKEDRP